MNFIKKNKFTEVIVKPELGSFKTGFKIIKNVTEKKITDYLERLKKNGYRRILIQEFIPEFNKFGEIKTYWINGKNIYSYKQQWADGEGVFQPQDKIEKELLKEISSALITFLICSLSRFIIIFAFLLLFE